MTRKMLISESQAMTLLTAVTKLKHETGDERSTKNSRQRGHNRKARCHAKNGEPARHDEIAQGAKAHDFQCVDFTPRDHGAQFGRKGCPDARGQYDAGKKRP